VSGAADRTVRVWDPHSGKCVKTFEGHKAGVLAVKWSPDDSQIASGGADGDDAIKIWDLNSGDCKMSMHGHKGSVYSLSWRGDGKLLASGGADGVIRIWHLEADTQKRMVTMLHPRGHGPELPGVLSVAWGPVGDIIACGTWADTVKVWDAAKGTCVWSLAGHKDWVRSVAWSHDGRRIVSGSADRSLRFWDLAGNKGKGQCVKELQEHTKPVRAVACTTTTPFRVASGGGDASIVLWNIADGTVFGRLHGHEQDEVTGLSWNADASLLASACAGGRVRVWEMKPGALSDVKPTAVEEPPATAPAEVSEPRDVTPATSAEAADACHVSVPEGDEVANAHVAADEHMPETDPSSPAASNVESCLQPREDDAQALSGAAEAPGGKEVGASATEHPDINTAPAGNVLNHGKTAPSSLRPCSSRIRLESIRGENDPSPSPTNTGLMLSLGPMMYVSSTGHNIPTIPFEDLKMDRQPLMTGPFKAAFRAKLDNREVAVLIFRQGSIDTEAHVVAHLGGRHSGSKFVLGTSMDDNGRSVLVCALDALRALDISTTQLLVVDATAKKLDYQEHIVSDAIMTGAREYQHDL